ncbi:mini-ribonuclease 3 [Tepidibacillus sp. HK-1]|nr:mini-ribonuclease 3 [Tepidibacillus sp. HK-1]
MEKEMIMKMDRKPLNPKEMNALTLAYMGDAVYELYIREFILSKGGKPNVLHKQAISYVSAKAQSRVLHYIMPLLTEEEADIVKRGRNTKSSTVPKNANVIEYRHSTAFEALIGFLYLSHQIDRLEQIVFEAIQYNDKRQDGEENGQK